MTIVRRKKYDWRLSLTFTADGKTLRGEKVLRAACIEDVMDDNDDAIDELHDSITGLPPVGDPERDKLKDSITSMTFTVERL